MIRLSVLFLGMLSVLDAASDSIGFAYADGNYRVQGASVRGNATLFEGATIEAGDAPAKLQLNAGSRIWITPGSRVTVSSHGPMLLRGLGQLEGPAGSALGTRAVKIVASAAGTVVRVALDDSGSATVAPSRGAVDVWNAHGTRVGIVQAGKAVNFRPEANPSAEVRVSGLLRERHGEFELTDRVTGVSMRLRGAALAANAGRLVSVAGLAEAAFVNVTSVEAAEQLNQQMPARITLVVVQGEGALNNIRLRTARESIVEVQDENHKPVAGASVLFALPRSGPGGTFANGATQLTVTTDAQGRAVARGFQPNRETGQFEIAVTATYGALTAAAIIRQTNAAVTPGTESNTTTGAGGAATTTGTATTGGTRGAAGGGGGTGTRNATITPTTVAIIGGIAATGVVGGLAASGAIFGSGSPESAASR
jgi:hypothetical protein